MDRAHTSTALRPLLVAAAAIAAVTTMTGCSPSAAAKLFGVPIPSTTTYTLSGTVSGLAGSGLVVSDGTDSVTINANGAFKFPNGLMSNMSYSVYVGTAPANPTQTCTVSNGTGVIGSANVSSVTISCITSAFMVTGNVSGLTGSGLVLADNGGDALTVYGNGWFSFASSVASGQPYAVTVRTAPANPAQSCVVSNGTGIVADADVTGVSVLCTTPTGTPTALATPTGSATGTAASALIDSRGGTLVTADGRATLTIPPNALSAATQISIQPITNEAPGGQGLAYRLGPAGQTFAQPVTLTFNYSGQDVRGSAPQSLGIAYQDPQMFYWHVYKKVTLDTNAQTVAVSTPHFSDWALLVGEQIMPFATGVKPGASVTFEIIDCPQVSANDPDTALVAQCGAPLLASLTGAPSYKDWSIEGIVGGNAALGTLMPSADGTSAVYTAPTKTPAPNPVGISVWNSAPLVGGDKEILFARATIDSCGTPSSECSWSGTARFAVAALSGSAYVTWVVDSAHSYSPGVYGFVPGSGSVSVRATDPNCTVTPAVLSLPQALNGALLVLDYTGTTPTYQLEGGVTADAFTMQCNGQSPYHPSVEFATTAGATPPVSADDRTITGSDATAGSGSSWTFVGE